LLVAVAPLLAAYLGFRAFSRPAGLSVIAGRGELLLIAAAIGGAAAGELVPFKTRRWKAIKILVLAITLFLAALSSMYFAFIALGIGATDPVVVSSDSLALAIATIATSAACIALSEI
jgi:hypothetical protein